MKKLSIILLSLALSACFSESILIKNESVALEKVIQSIEKHKLTSLHKECLLFLTDDRGDYYEIEIREKHNKMCGGDPQIAPRLFKYEINKQSGEMQTDYPVWSGEIRKID
ncbi:hypothetical protein A1D23_13460 [Chelonobacter oris]|uniref:hypothetical protein n=1 Tax=Chelonobacter oris TaxID=505317 RepID=UPI002448EB19|nr:hypothetical protein [Chelonobacter oris]MDH3001636.1 hypothetical protein [Chelonobacter oris]